MGKFVVKLVVHLTTDDRSSLQHKKLNLNENDKVIEIDD